MIFTINNNDVFAGISTYTFPWAVGISDESDTNKLTPLQLLDYAKRNKINYVQFGDNLPLHEFDYETLQHIKSFAAANSIRIEVGTRKLTVENATRYINIARFFKAAFLRIMIDDADYHPNVEEVIDVINKILPVLKNNSMILAIENHDRFKAATLKHIIQSTYETYIGICLDTANSLGAGQGIDEVLPVLKPYVINLHIKDISIKRVDDKMGFIVEGTAAGDGMIDIPSIINQLEETGRCKTATLEVWSNACGTVEETISREKQLAEKSIHYIKQFLS